MLPNYTPILGAISVLMAILIFSNNGGTPHTFLAEGQFQNQTASIIGQPRVLDPSLKVELVYNGSGFPTNMAFIGPDDILLLSKDDGKVLRIKDGKNIGSALKLEVRSKDEMGLLGIATSKQLNPANASIFLYFTACKSKTDCNNLVYRYRWDSIHGNLTEPRLLLKLPALPGPSHQGGDMTLGPDGYLYVSIGDLTPTKLFNKDKRYLTKAQNHLDGLEPDGRAGILRITQDGKPVDKGIFGSIYPLSLYYAYGIKNSFGIGFDPVTGKLWETDNGPKFGDEINLVEPGFNGGWSKVQGFWMVNNTSSDKMEMIKGAPEDLVDFEGKGEYSDPKLVWDKSVAPTALVFLNSDKLGSQYKNDMFVGSVKNGIIFHLKLNDNRTDLALPVSLKNRIVADSKVSGPIIFAEDFGIVTDLEVGPYDGYVYVVSGDKSSELGTIHRIVPKTG